MVDEVHHPGTTLGVLPRIAAAWVGWRIARAMLAFGDDYAWTWIGERFLLDVRTHLLAHVQRLAPHTLDRRRLGDTLSASASRHRRRSRGSCSRVSATPSRRLPGSLIFAGVLFLLDWQLALYALVVAPPVYVVARRFARLVSRVAREKRRRGGALTAVTEESIANIALVQSVTPGPSTSGDASTRPRE